MNRTEEIKLLEQLEQWNSKDEYSQCIQVIEAIPEQERGYLLTVKLSRAYSNLAVLGDHGVHGTDGEVDGDLIRHAIDLLESVRTEGALHTDGREVLPLSTLFTAIFISALAST